MNEGNSLKKYLKATFFTKIMTLICILIVGAAICITVYYAKSYTLPEAEYLTLDTKSQTYSYIDVQYLSEWVYKIDETTYYDARDVDGYSYLVILSNKQFNEFSDIVKFTYSEKEDKVAPPSKKIYGTAKKITKSLAEDISRHFDFESVDEYYDYYGKMVLNGKSSPQNTGYIAAAVAFVFTIISVLLIIGLIKTSIKIKKSFKHLAKIGEQENAEYEFERSDQYLYSKHKIILTKNFVFIKGKGIVIKHKDILWCYNRKQYYNGVKCNDSLVFDTALFGSIQAINFGARKNKYGDFDTILAIIFRENPNVLLGYNKENRRESNRLKKEKRNNLKDM